MPALNLIIVLGIIVLASTPFIAQAQRSVPNDDVLKRSTGNQSFENITTTDALSRALTITNSPGGIVVKQECTEPAKYSFRKSGPTLRAFLDSLVSTDRAYKWEAADGTLNLLLRSGDPPLLKLRIRELKIDGVSSASLAIDQLRSRPDVRRRIRELGLTEGVVRIGPSDLSPPAAGPNQYVRKLSLDLKNVSLRQALNAIVQAHGQAIWAYTEQHCRGRNDFTVDLLRQ